VRQPALFADKSRDAQASALCLHHAMLCEATTSVTRGASLRFGARLDHCGAGDLDGIFRRASGLLAGDLEALERLLASVFGVLSHLFALFGSHDEQPHQSDKAGQQQQRKDDSQGTSSLEVNTSVLTSTFRPF
jgi:hypothetical protein